MLLLVIFWLFYVASHPRQKLFKPKLGVGQGRDLGNLRCTAMGKRAVCSRRVARAVGLTVDHCRAVRSDRSCRFEHGGERGTLRQNGVVEAVKIDWAICIGGGNGIEEAVGKIANA